MFYLQINLSPRPYFGPDRDQVNFCQLQEVFSVSDWNSMTGNETFKHSKRIFLTFVTKFWARQNRFRKKYLTLSR